MIKSSTSARRVFQFKIKLLDIAPTIWRRIQVPDSYSFWDLHVAIQDAMGWWDSHLHEFRIKRKHAHKTMLIGILDEEGFDDDKVVEAGWQKRLDHVFWEVGSVFEYEYDLGDGWVHEITHEGVLIRDSPATYPRCVEGARACPPEDCGGPPGYERLLAVLSDPNHEEYESMRTWVGGNYDPEKFDPTEIRFDNPTIRLRNLFQ